MGNIRRRLAAILVFTMVFELLPSAVIPAYAQEEELMADTFGEGELLLADEPVPAGLIEDEPDAELITEEALVEETIPQGDTEDAGFGTDGISYLVPEQRYNNITWSIDSNGCLYVSGTNDFKEANGAYAPWYPYRSYIKQAEINLTNYTKWLSRMFDGCEKLEKVTFKKLEAGSVVDVSNMFRNCKSLKIIDATKISPKSNSKITNMSGLFDGCSSLTDVYLVEYKAGSNQVTAKLDSTAVTDMSYMFRGCSSLTGIDLSQLDTTKVTNMNGMFSGCNSLTYLDLTKIYVGNVDSAADMLNCQGLVSVNSPRFLKDKGNKNVEISLPGSGWMRTDTKLPVTALTYDIPNGTLVTTDNPSDEDKILAKGDIKNKVFWTIYKDGTLVVMGNGEIRNTSADLPPWLDYTSDIKRAEINLEGTYDLSYMFSGCSSLSMANLSRLKTTDATNMSNMFSGCRALTEIDLSGFSTSKVTKMQNMFKNCTSLTSLDLFCLDTSKVTDMSGMFENCSSITEIDFAGKDSGKLKGMPRLFTTAEVRNMTGIFKGCSSLVNLDLGKFDLGKTNMAGSMLTGCVKLETLYSPANKEIEIDLPRCDTTPLGVWKNNSDNKRVNSIPKNTASGTCFTYETEEGTYENVKWWIDINHVLHVEGRGNFRASDGLVPWAVYTNDIHTAKINLTESTDLSRMFESCDKLTDITWENNTMTAVCTNMLGMFRGCKSLRTVDLSDFTTTRVENMSYMFEGCELMETISIGGFNTGKVMDVRGMFRNCTKLKELNLSNFDLSSVFNSYLYDRMLENCTALEKVYSPDKLGYNLMLPAIDGKGWRLEVDEGVPPKRYNAIPAGTKKGTAFVTALNITGITLYEGDGTTPINTSYDLDPGDTMKVVAKVTPAGADPLDIVWTSKYTDIATVTVNKGSANKSAGTVEVTVTAGSTTGNSLITASFGDAEEKIFTVRVSSALKLTPPAIDIISGKTIEDAITVTITDPAYTMDDIECISQYKKVVWDKKIDGNKITIESKSGLTANRKVEFTVATKDGKYSDICVVTVVPDPDPEPAWGEISEQYIRDKFSNDPKQVPTGLWYLMPRNIGLSNNEVEYEVYLDSDTLDYGRIYTGSNITFDEELRVYYGVRRLWSERDYNILYRNNKFAADSDDEKAPFFTINGIGSFQNSVTFKFNIFPEDINNAELYSDAVVPVDLKTKLGTIQPSLRYKESKLTPGRDIVLTYYKNEVKDENLIEDPKRYQAAAGETYFVDIKGKDGSDFTGTWNTPVKLITIDPKDKSYVRLSNVRVKTSQLEWKESGYKLKDLFDNTVSDNEVFRVFLDGYDLVYGKDFTVDDILLYDSGDYKVKLHGTGVASGDSAGFVGEKTVKIEIKGTPASKVRIAAFTNKIYYTGDVITLEDLHVEDSSDLDKVTLYIVRDGKEVFLAEGTDYDYEMVNSGATGKFDLVFTLKGAYNGVIKKSIRVLRYNIADDKKKLIDVETENTTFSRGGVKPGVTVYFDGKELTENIDYTLSYKNNNKLGEETDGPRAPQVIITGIGNFSGKITDKFTISKAKLKNLELILDDKDYKAKFAKNYFKSSPRIMEGGAAVKIGKDKDIEPIDKNAYTYRYAGGGAIIPDAITSGIPDGALIEVSVQITAGEKSPYEAETRTLTGYYRFVSKYKNIKNSKVSLITPSEIICSDSEAEVMDMLDKNLKVTIKNEKNEMVTLVKGRDYEVTSLTDYMKPGTGSIILKGLNDYSGTITYKFKMYRRKQ